MNAEPKFLLRVADQRFVTAEYPVAKRVLVFAPNGRFERELRGPSEGIEFSDAHAAFVGPEGRLHIIDRFANRQVTFDSRWRVVGSTSFPDLDVHAVRHLNGVTYYNAVYRTAEAIGLPIHTLDGPRVVNSFGSLAPIARPDAPEIGQRAMTGDAADLWTARRTHYLLERWNKSGRRTEAFERKADWFRPYLVRKPLSPDNTPEPWISAIEHVGDGRLLVLIDVPELDFRDKLVPVKGPDGQTFYSLGNCPELKDTIVEMVDVTKGSLVFSSRHDECLVGFVQIGDSYGVYGYRLDGDATRVDVYHLDIHSTNRSRR